ncbi:hypothetical protein HK103_005000 [Boothiomyces macroporosus]|uniref:Adhesin domain-containing protein n=1 Tax=Boothiomyces macroporosus TaxID=261099 RepID=A0AAD5Y5H8_9FUNG|nr:hypothetical protein HK103_005000 [Boothiomyces macroporosus]
METTEETPLLQNSPNDQQQGADKKSFKDWIPAIIVGLLFILTTILIFAQVGNNGTSDVIYSKILKYSPDLVGLDVTCVGHKECQVEIEKERTNQNLISLVYLIESKEPKAMKLIDLTLGKVGSKLHIFINTTKIPEDALFISNFKIFLPQSVGSGFDINFATDVGSISIDSIPQTLGSVNTNIGVGSVKFDNLQIRKLDLLSSVGDTTVYNTNIMESVSCQSFAGSITTQLSSIPDGSLNSVNLTTISGYIHADINDYNQLYVASESGYIEVNANPKPRLMATMTHLLLVEWLESFN